MPEISARFPIVISIPTPLVNMRVKNNTALWAVALIWVLFAGAILYFSPLGRTINLAIIGVFTLFYIDANIER